MSKKEKKDLVPALRFPEFRNSDSWMGVGLGKLSIILRGGSPRPIDNFMTRDKDGLNWLKIGDVDKSAKYISMTEERVIVEALSKTREVHPGDLIMSNSMSFGRPYIMEIKTCIHDGWIAVTEIDQSISRDFLYYFILSESSQFYFLNAAAGGGIKNLNADIIKVLPVAHPESGAEQQKIANCLSSIDELVTVQSQKLEALKAHKKGLMQQLFPAEGETVPKFRFPEFRGKEDWSDLTLSKVITLVSGMHLSPDEYGDSGSLPYFTGPSDFTNNKTEISKWTSESTNQATKDDVLITVKGNGVGELWYLLIPDVSMGRQLMAIRAKNCVSRFIYQFLLTKKGLFEVLGSGNLIPGLSRPDILKLELRIPSRKEQEKISDCLSSIDELIISQNQKIEALKRQKKGLMQQLFPAVDEVSA